jgi:CubicO group peptidase (beta-lactamase class C family)
MKILVFLSILTFLCFFYTSTQSVDKQNNSKLKYSYNRDSLTYAQGSIKSPLVAEYFKKLCTANKFNGNILVAENGEILYDEARGYSDYDKKEELKLNSRFQIASLSKQFTAVAILKLYENGQLGLDDLVTKYYPDFPYSKVSIRMLLSHRSGVPSYEGLEAHPFRDGFRMNNQLIMELYANKKPRANFAANQRFKYSNAGYAVLASLVEKISNMSFTDYVQQNLFNPAQMNNSYFLNWDDSTGRENVTTGYQTGWRKAIPTYLDGVYGDKGIYSTIYDLFKWDQALYTEKILKQSTLDLAFKGENAEMPGRRNYGFGWRTRILEDGSKMVYHGGWWRGYRALFARILPNQGTIIILGNQHNHAFTKNYHLLLNILKPEFINNKNKKPAEQIEDDIVGGKEKFAQGGGIKDSLPEQ